MSIDLPTLKATIVEELVTRVAYHESLEAHKEELEAAISALSDTPKFLAMYTAAISDPTVGDAVARVLAKYIANTYIDNKVTVSFQLQE